MRTQGQQVLLGAAAEAAVVGRVGGCRPPAVVMARGLGQGLWNENQHGVPFSHQPMEMSSFQPLQQLTWGQSRISAWAGNPRGPLPNMCTRLHAHILLSDPPNAHLVHK